MILLDASVLLLAHNRQAEHHLPVLKWLQNRLDAGDLLGLPWVTVWAFLRIATNRRAFPQPLSGQEASEIVWSLLELPNVVAISPGLRHLELLASMVGGEDAVGPLVTDAVIAALAKENAAIVASTDQDFRRFDVPWINPALPT